MSYTWRWDTMEEWPKDLFRMDVHAKRAMGQAMMNIAEEMRRSTLEVYMDMTFGGRTHPTYYTGAWGSSLRLITRGTGMTQGQAYVILTNTAGYAGDLESATVTGGRFKLEIWAETKLGMTDRQARNYARKIEDKRRMSEPAPRIFNEALGPDSGFQQWADAEIREALDRVLVLGGKGA